MSKRTILMLIGCVLPLLLIFLLPVYGIGDRGIVLFIFILLMFACHLLMPMGHGKQKDTAERHPHGGEV